MTEKQKNPPPEEKKPDPALPTEAVAAEDHGDLHPAEVIEAQAMELLNSFQQPHLRGSYDQRLVAIARTQIELGFLALYRAIAKAEG